MKEPQRIPLSDNPRCKEPKKIPLEKLYLDSIQDDLWEKHDTVGGPPVFAKKNENNQQNNTTSISELESNKID